MTVSAGHRSLGWKRQPFDKRDRRFLPPRAVVLTLAQTTDLSGSMGPQLNQGAEGSCGPNTADEIIQFDQKIESLTVQAASRLFIYYNTRAIMGTISSDSGVDNRSMMKAMADQGFCPESMWPYDDTPASMVKKPTQACYTAAVANRITNYASVTQSLDQMQGTISSGRCFMFGFDVFNQIMSEAASMTGIITTPTLSDNPIGGHDVTFCGYSNVELPGVKSGNKWPAGYFKFRNHWLNSDGSAWGDGGYGYCPYDYALGSHASDFWVFNVPGGGITPPPGPGPGPSPGPGPVTDLKTQVDAVFAKLEAMYSRSPQLLYILQVAQRYVDAYLALHPLGISMSEGSIPASSCDFSVPFGMAKQQNPQYAQALAVTQLVVEGML